MSMLYTAAVDSNGEKEGAPSTEPETLIESNLNYNSSIVSSLMSLGIASQNACIRATIAVNNSSVEQACEWLFIHLNQPDINDPIQTNQSINNTNSSSSISDLQEWCLNHNFSMDLYNRLTRPPMHIDTLQKLKLLTSDNDINELVQELGLRFGKKASFVQAMKQLKQTELTAKTETKQSSTPSSPQEQTWECQLCSFHNNVSITQCKMCSTKKPVPSIPKQLQQPLNNDSCKINDKVDIKKKPSVLMKEEKTEEKVEESRLSCNRCSEEFSQKDWSRQNVILENGMHYTHLICPKWNKKEEPAQISYISNIGSSAMDDKSYDDIKYAPNPDLTEEEMEGDCHIRDHVIPYRTLQESNFLKLYDKTKQIPDYDDIISHLPEDLVDDFRTQYKSICKSFEKKESKDHIIGRTCVHAWTYGDDEDSEFTASPFYCKLNAAILSDHSELLKRWMYLIRGLNRFLVNTRPKQPIVCYRKSDLSMEQFKRIKVGKKYRIAIYTATSTDKEFVKKWHRNNGKFYWIFNVPKGCFNACCISEYSYHGEESEVLMPPYSSIQIISKKDGYIKANVLDNKHCSMSLPTIVS